MASPSSVSVIIPAFNEAGAITDVVDAIKGVGAWHEVIVVDDGSTDATSTLARGAGAVVVKHPYNKGNGAAVKSGIRRATGEYVLIVDGDGQHQAADAVTLVQRLGEYDLVIGARTAATQANLARRAGNSTLNRFASYLTGTEICDLTSGFRAARREHLLEFLHLLPNGFSTPTTTTLAFIKAGYNVAFEPTNARPRVGASNPEDRHHLQSAAGVSANRRRGVPARCVVRRMERRGPFADSQRRRAPDSVFCRGISRWSRFRADLGSADRRGTAFPRMILRIRRPARRDCGTIRSAADNLVP